MANKTRITAALIALALCPALPVSGANAKLPDEFVAHLEAARTPAEQDALIRSASLAFSSEILCQQLLAHAYQLTLTGSYLRAASICEFVLRRAQETGDGEHAAAAEIELAFVLRESGDLAGALALINRAVEFYQAHPKFETAFSSRPTRRCPPRNRASRSTSPPGSRSRVARTS